MPSAIIMFNSTGEANKWLLKNDKKITVLQMTTTVARTNDVFKSPDRYDRAGDKTLQLAWAHDYVIITLLYSYKKGEKINTNGV